MSFNKCFTNNISLKIVGVLTILTEPKFESKLKLLPLNFDESKYWFIFVEIVFRKLYHLVLLQKIKFNLPLTQVWSFYQCDQIGRFLTVLGNKTSINRSPNDLQFLGYFDKPHSHVNTASATFRATFWKLFTPTSGHTCFD